MSTELKPGMMALVIGSVGNRPETIGRIIEIDSILKRHAQWNNSGEILYTRLEHLMPIKPQADPLHTKEEQHASA